MANDPKTYRKYIADITDHYTRWFNLHSRAHMEKTYPRGLKWYLSRDGSKPIYTQKFWADIPGCQAFPHSKIQSFFNTNYFTCSIAWLIAFAILEGFERIELWGFRLSDGKPGHAHAWERPCFFYWVKQARDRGIEVTYQQEIQALPHIAGDPSTYDGPLYGYDTKPEGSVPEPEKDN
jgi:hypothetical protein